MLFFLRGVIGGFFKIEGSMCVGGCMCECVGGDLGEDGCTVNLEGSVEEKQDWSQGRGLLSTPDNPPFVRCPESQQRFVSKNTPIFGSPPEDFHGVTCGATSNVHVMYKALNQEQADNNTPSLLSLAVMET